MSGSAQGAMSTTKLIDNENKSNGEPAKDTQKPAAVLEEDDEFEDFPVEGR